MVTTTLPERCVVLVPVGHHIEPGCDAALRTLEARGYEVRRVYGFSAIDQGRSQIATRALADGFDELFWIDSDVVFDPNDVDRLRAHARPVCCGIYPKKGRRAFATNFKSDQRTVRFGRGGGLIEVERTGFGFTLTHRDVYETIRSELELPVCNVAWGEPLVPYFLPMVAHDERGASYLAEDFAFCDRARRVNFSIYADTSIRLWHVGSYPYGWEDAGRPDERFTDYRFHVGDP